MVQTCLIADTISTQMVDIDVDIDDARSLNGACEQENVDRSVDGNVDGNADWNVGVHLQTSVWLNLFNSAQT